MTPPTQSPAPASASQSSSLRGRTLEWVFRHRWMTLCACFVFTVLCLFSTIGLRMRENILDLLPKKDPVIGEFKQILSDFNQLNTLLVEVGPADNQTQVSEEELIGVADQLAGRMRDSLHFKRITYRIGADDIPAALQSLRERRAGLFTEDDQLSLTQRLTPATLRRILEGWKRQLYETPAPFIAQSLARDPLGMDELLLKKINAVQALDGPISMHQGRLFSRDLKHILIVAEPVAPSTDSARSRQLVDFMDQAIAKVKQSTDEGHIQIAYLSGHRMSLENASRIKADLKLTLILSFVSIAILSLIVYRRPLWVLLTFLPTFFGGVFALGLLRWISPNFSGIAIGCGSMLMGIAVDLGIFILYHADQHSDRTPTRAEIIALVEQLFWPLMLCSGTTIATFLALLWSELPGYKDLGLFAVLGFIGATLFAIYILPLLIPLRKRTKTREPLVRVATVFPPFYIWLDRHRLLTVLLLIGASLLAAPGLLKLRFEGDYQKLNAVSTEIRRDWDRILDIFGSALYSTSIVVRGKTIEEGLRENERVYAVLKQLQAEGIIQSIQSIAPLLPSQAAQARNAQRWREFWSGARLADLNDQLSQACQELRMRPEAFTPFLQSLPGPVAPLTLDELEKGMFGHLISSHVSHSPVGASVLTSLKPTRPEDHAKIKQALKEAGVNFISYHGPQFLRHIIEMIYREMIWISILTIILVVLMLAAYYHTLRQMTLIILPLLVNLFWTFGMMGWLGVTINMMNSMIVAFIFGVVVDYSIFLVTTLDTAKEASDEYLAHSSVAIVMSALTTMIGLGVMVIARHPALHSIGITALLGIGSGLVAVFLITPLAKRYPNQSLPSNPSRVTTSQEAEHVHE